MKKNSKTKRILAAIQLHNSQQRVLFYDVDKKDIIRIFPLTQDVLSSCVEILRANKKTYIGLIAIFGAKRFSTSRVAALLVNVCAQIWNKKKGLLVVPEDANKTEISSKLAKVSLSDTVIVPQYAALPNITKRKA